MARLRAAGGHLGNLRGAHFPLQLRSASVPSAVLEREKMMTAEVGKDTTKKLRIALMLVLCVVILGATVLRSYQAGVENQAKNSMRDANNHTAIAAAQKQIQSAKLGQPIGLAR
jgi:uncharacterized protein HemX